MKRKTNKKNMKICLVGSSGGHLTHLIVAGFSGVSLLLSAISLFVKSTEKCNGLLLNIVWIVYILDAAYFVILALWIPYTSRNLCFQKTIIMLYSTTIWAFHS